VKTLVFQALAPPLPQWKKYFLSMYQET
jgi:hypothetical protein